MACMHCLRIQVGLCVALHVGMCAEVQVLRRGFGEDLLRYLPLMVQRRDPGKFHILHVAMALPSFHHCPYCKVCRRGRGLNIDNYHCPKCNNCLSLKAKYNHVCRDNNLYVCCPICGEWLQNSREVCISLRCGHAMHNSCLRTYLKVGDGRMVDRRRTTYALCVRRRLSIQSVYLNYLISGWRRIRCPLLIMSGSRRFSATTARSKAKSRTTSNTAR